MIQEPVYQIPITVLLKTLTSVTQLQKHSTQKPVDQILITAHRKTQTLVTLLQIHLDLPPWNLSHRNQTILFHLTIALTIRITQVPQIVELTV